MFPGPIELPLIGYSIEPIQPQETLHVMNGIIFCVRSTSAISVLQIVLNWCQEELKKNQVKKESQQSQDQWWVWLPELPQLCHLRHQKARGREVMKVKVVWVNKLINMIERGNPLLAVTQVSRQGTTSDSLKVRTQQAAQDGSITKLGLLKSGNLMNWWMVERWHPLFALNEEQEHSNSSFGTTK